MRPTIDVWRDPEKKILIWGALEPGDLVRMCRERLEECVFMDETDRLVYALAIMTQRIAETYRDELDGMAEQVKRLEERVADVAPELSYTPVLFPEEGRDE